MKGDRYIRLWRFPRITFSKAANSRGRQKDRQRQTDRHTGRYTDRPMDRRTDKTDKQTYGKTDRQTDTQNETKGYMKKFAFCLYAVDGLLCLNVLYHNIVSFLVTFFEGINCQKM